MKRAYPMHVDGHYVGLMETNEPPYVRGTKNQGFQRVLDAWCRERGISSRGVTYSQQTAAVAAADEE